MDDIKAGAGAFCIYEEDWIDQMAEEVVSW